MPITILNKSYADDNGVTRPFYMSNAGDQTIVTYTLLEQIIVVSNAQNVLMLNFFENTITWSNGNWLKEGFAVGDSVYVKKYDQYGTLLATDQATIITITGLTFNVLKLDDLINAVLPNPANFELLVVHPATDYRSEEVVATFNHVASGSTGSEYSLIDGEPTVFRFDIKSMPFFPYIAGGTTLLGDAIGKRSGQFEVIAELVFSNATPPSVGFQIAFGFVYDLRFTIINSGVYNSTWFNFNNCLKIHNKIEHARFLGQPFNRNSFVVSDEANTGWYDEPYNVGITDAVLVQGVSNLAFDTLTNAQIIIDCDASLKVSIGGCYISDNEDYYKNVYPSQSELGMCIASTPSYLFPLASPINPSGAWWELLVGGNYYVGTQRILDIKFIPMGNFTSFMEGREEGDRLFYLWVKVGNQNLLVWSGQLISNPAIGGEIEMVQNIFLDHSENVVDSVNTYAGYEANVEDDLAFVGKFRLEENQVYQSMTARIEAYNSVTGEEFTLASVNYNFASVPMVAGKYALNLTAPVITILPTTSVKRTSEFVLEPSVDFGTEYGVKIYFPFLYRWEYWLPQLNASGDFYPNQNKNWVQYSGGPDWQTRLHLELVKDNEGYVFDDMIIVKDYDSEPNIFQTIDLYRVLDNSLLSVVIAGEMHKIIATHTNVALTPWGNKTWGMITIEPTESSPRWLVSTIVDYDNNSANPLTPISGLLVTITYPQPHVAVMECLFDASKINIASGVKFTTKIKSC